MRRMSWWRVGPAAVVVVVVSWVFLTRRSVLLAGHPALPVTMAVILLAALAVFLLGLRRPQRDRAHRVRRVALRVLGLLLAVVVMAAVVYLRPFGVDAPASALTSTSDVAVAQTATTIELTPRRGAVVGFAFWPGARVDARAYIPLLRAVAADGVLVVILKEPYGISFANPDAASDAIDDHPTVKRWAVGGHSLGGVTAAGYAEDHDVAGLVLWASYPLDSLADRSDLPVLSVSGTKDGLTTPADVRASAAKLPSTTEFVAIDGGVHAYFGDYGAQPGDGTATRSRGSAQAQIVEATADFLTELFR